MPSSCIYATKVGNVLKCSLSLCPSDDLETCCTTCTEYSGPDRGLGDTVKRATSALGIKTCGGCQARRERMNRWSKSRKRKGNTQAEDKK
jgi:hypothetical protein